MLLNTLSVQQDGLTLREVIANIPHDAAAIFVYLLIAAFVGIPLWLSRGGDASPGDKPEGPGEKES